MAIKIIAPVLLVAFFGIVCSVLALTDTEILSIGATVGSIPTVDETSGGSGTTQSGVRFSGFAYPRAIVTVQKGITGDISVVADARGAFSIVIPGTVVNFFTLFATDSAGRRSTILNFPTVFYNGYLTDISGIRFAPTITVDKLSIKRGDFITVAGAAIPEVPAEIIFDGPESKLFTVSTNASGIYNITAPLMVVDGEYTVRARYTDDARSSKAIRLIVGAATIPKTDATANTAGDCNVDGRVDIVDFSVLAYWFNKKNPPSCVDPNGDNMVTLVDFSIVAFYWNG